MYDFRKHAVIAAFT